MKHIVGLVLFLAAFAFAFAPQIGTRAGKFVLAYDQARMACVSDKMK